MAFYEYIFGNCVKQNKDEVKFIFFVFLYIKKVYNIIIGGCRNAGN